MRLLIQLFLTSTLLNGPYASADSLFGRVVSVADGDTLTLLDNSNVTHKIRLAAIDAPEKAMPFGQRSKEALSQLCYGKSATIKVVDTDRYGRTVGVVACNGVTANDRQVQTGMAWVYPKYANKFGHLYELEYEARASAEGLWFDPNPMPPWEWRHHGHR